MRRTKAALGGLALAAALGITGQAMAEGIKIGFIGTLSGAGGEIGTHALEGLQLALAQHDNKLGGQPVTLLVGDDQQKADVGRSLADKFTLSDKVDVIVAATFSNILLALYQPTIQNKTILFSVVAGPSQIAGKSCSPYFFNDSWQGDNLAEAMGAYLQKQAVPGVFTLAPNYAAGKDVITGFKRYFKGPIVGERLTPVSQLDFAAELAEIRAADPPAVFAFYPGGLGIQFLKQFAQSGLGQKTKLYTAYTIDDLALPAIGDAALGDLTTLFWSTTIDNPPNRAFVTAFRKKTDQTPSFYAATGYDAGNILDAAVGALKGAAPEPDALSKAIATAKFASVRGNFRFANDHFPIQDYYLGEVQKASDGRLEVGLRDLVMSGYGNAYQAECPMTEVKAADVN